MNRAQIKKVLSFIERRHPKYWDSADHWQFLIDTYEGGREWFKENIHRYYKESDEEFKDRIKRAYRFNHTREVVGLVNKYVFRGEIKRKEEAPESVKDFWKSATIRQETIDQFMRQVDVRSSIFGRICVIVDSNADGESRNLKQQRDRGERTYAYIVSPLDILDMAFDDDGELLWLKILERKRDDRDPINDDGCVVEQIKLWTRTNFRVWVENEKKKGQWEEDPEKGGPNAIGRVPAVFVNCMEISDCPYTAPSLINDIAYLDRAVANYLSNLDAIMQDQSFSQLAIPLQAIGDDSLSKKVVEMGTKRIFTFNGEDGAMPFYLSPDVKQASLITDVVKQLIGEIYHSVGMAGERTKQDNSQGIDNSSGVAKAFDFERVNSLLIAKSKALELAENKIAELVRLWNGEKDGDGHEVQQVVWYPRTFDVRGLADDMQLASELSLLNAPKAIQQEQMRRVVEKLHPHVAQKISDEIERQIKDWPPDPIEEPAPKGAAPGLPKKVPTQGSNQANGSK